MTEKQIPTHRKRAFTAPANWLWLLDLRVGDGVIVSEDLMHFVAAQIGAFGAVAVSLTDVRSDEAAAYRRPCRHAVLSAASTDSHDARQSLDQAIALACRLIAPGGALCVTDVTPNHLDRRRRASLSSALSSLAGAGFSRRCTYRLGPNRTDARCIVPETLATTSGFLRLDPGLNRLGSLRLRLAKLGATGIALPGYLIVAST